ncbi:MAG: exodeoxyribonuclease III [Pseudomonadota bacterium]
MKIATWNINGMKARLDFILHWLANRDVDVVGLQELKMMDDAFPHAAFADAGFTCVTHGQKSWNGVAILSRLPVEVTQVGLPGQEDFGARLITARIDDDIEYTTVYCPNGKTLEHADYERKLDWFASLAEHWQSRDRSASVIAGDFNIVPTALDGHGGEAADGTLFHSSPERDALAALTQTGLIDVYRALHPDERAFSWWDYRGGSFHRNQGLRIDYLLAAPAIAARATAVEIDRDYRKKRDGLTASDHAPVIATF